MFARGYQDKFMSIFDEIHAQLSTHEKRFKLSALSENARMRSYEKAFFWLTDAQITNPCFAASDPSVSLSLSRSQSSMKCYMADTGLLCALALANGATTAEELYRNVLLGNVAINEGMLVENFVAQTLASKGDKLFFYAQTSSKKGCERMEVDFLIVRPFADAGGKPRVVPIEVKSGNKYSTTSLDRFSQKFASKVGMEVVLHPGQLRKEGKRLFVPLYLTHLL